MKFVFRRRPAPAGLRGAAIVPERLESRVLFSNSASIAGTLWSDVNANGIWDTPPDGRLSGWTVYLDSNNNGSLDAGEPTCTTNSFGQFLFGGLAAGTYTLRYVAQGGYTATLGWSDHASITLADGQALTTASFGLTLSNGQISGTVLDVAGGVSSPLQGFGAYLDLNGNGKVDPGEPWTGTDAQGHFSFSHLTAGVSYVVRIDPPHPTWSFDPAGGVINVTSDGVSTVPVTFKLTPNSPPASYQPSQIVDYWLIGGSSADASARFVGQGLASTGWTGFVSQRIQPDIAWGARRIELHNPFGIGASEAFQADQFLEAQAAGLTWLTNDFVSAWKPITSSGVEAIAYIGSPEQDPSFQALVNNPAAWNARFQASIAPIVSAGMSIAFDMGQTMTQGDLFYQALQSLHTQGVKVYLENRPPESASFNWQFPVIATADGWDASSPYLNTADWWAAKNSQLPAGNVVELFQNGAGTDPASVISQVQAVLYKGDNAGINVAGLIAMGITRAQLLTPPRPPTLTGDVNGDGTVGLADLTLLERNFGTTTAPFQNGDLNGDGTVSLADLLILTRNFGKSSTTVSVGVSVLIQPKLATTSLTTRRVGT